MPGSGFDTPVVLIVFNRPDLTAQVFERIAELRPRALHVIADGPRADRPADRELCAATRKLVEGIDWSCDLTLDYADTNLGCGPRIASGLGRAFERFEEAIILEDDCLPHPSFFAYCEELLDHYRDRPEVMSITGELDSKIRPPDGESYFFSSLTRIWGWATWARAWRGFDFELREWPGRRAEFLERLNSYYKGGRPLCRRMDKVVEDRIDTWDYQWWYHVFANRGLCINPRVNLISNIGFDDRGTHMTTEGGRDRSLESAALPTPLIHPARVELDQRIDRQFFRERFGRPLAVRAWRALQRMLETSA